MTLVSRCLTFFLAFWDLGDTQQCSVKFLTLCSEIMERSGFEDDYRVWGWLYSRRVYHTLNYLSGPRCLSFDFRIKLELLKKEFQVPISSFKASSFASCMLWKLLLCFLCNWCMPSERNCNLWFDHSLFLTNDSKDWNINLKMIILKIYFRH